MSAVEGPVALVADAAPRRRLPDVLRWAIGGLVLTLLLRQLGSDPFLDGLRAVTPTAVLAALALTAGTTYCCARRWSLVAAGHGVTLPICSAYAAYYRSQLINATLPGGVVGDLHRGARHGWQPVVWERVIGQVVQVGLVGALVLPGQWPLLALAAVAAGALGLGSRGTPHAVRAMIGWSALSTAGHLLIFLVAAHAARAGLPLSTLLPIGALVLLGASLPFNLAGWGPREGMAVWAFTAYGATAAAGLTAAVTFGVLSTLATLPGLLVPLVVSRGEDHA